MDSQDTIVEKILAAASSPKKTLHVEFVVGEGILKCASEDVMKTGSISKGVAMKRKPIEPMTPDERAVLRRAIADYMRALANLDGNDLKDAQTRIASMLDIKPRRDGTYNFAQYETPREK